MRRLIQEYGLLKHLLEGKLRDFLLVELPDGSFGRKAIKYQQAARSNSNILVAES